ncbi:MAG TPA: PDDEXK nuclease domain-containing protein [Anaerolineae bacterium]|nr:PDDEXK nuclease domain-containing protein [Anaerolineae bacterium]
MPTQMLELSPHYAVLLASLQERIRSAQTRAVLSVNRELVLLYWHIGREILIQQDAQGWGARVIERLSQDLRQAFPGMKGFSARNLKYMRAFADAWTDEQFVQEVLAQITWYHNIALLEKLDLPTDRTWYARKAIENGWSRNILVHQIDTNLRQRLGGAQSNFERTLPAPQSELAQQLLKDPYTFDFLGLGEDAHERDLERALIEHLRSFLLELGMGFAFVGNQYHLEVGGQDFYLDLLFYHFRLRCFVVIDLKIGAFQPEDAGKMNFYLSAVDDLLGGEQDQPAIGLILCREKNRVIVEYALRDLSKPIGVSAYQLTRALPEGLKGSLPTIEELEAELTPDQ